MLTVVQLRHELKDDMLTVVKLWHKLEDDILHDAVGLEAEQRLCLVDLEAALRTVLVALQELDHAALADWNNNPGYTTTSSITRIRALHHSAANLNSSTNWRSRLRLHVWRHSVIVVASMK